MCRRHGRHEREENRQQHGQREGPPRDDPDTQARPHADSHHRGRGESHGKHCRVEANDHAVGDREPTAVGAVAAIGDNHGSRAHDRALSDGVQRRDEQDHLREDQQNTGDEQQVLPRVGAPSALGNLVLGDLRGQGRGIGWAGKHVAGENGKARGVELADLRPRDGRGAGDIPGRLRPPGDREAVDRQRAVTNDRA